MSALLFYFIISHTISFFCSIFEAVLLCSTGGYISLLRKKNPPVGNLLHELKTHINQPLAAILTLNTAAHTFGAAGVGAEVVELFGNYWLGLVSVILTLTMLFLTEMIPKTLGALYWKSIAPVSAYCIKFLIIITYPFVIAFEAIARLLTKGTVNDKITEEEIKHTLAEGAKTGIFKEAEYDMIESILRLTNRRVGVLMTPRKDIKWLDLQLSTEEMKSDVEKISFSRFPLCNGELDQVVGIINTKKALKEILEKGTLDLFSLVQAPVYVPENMKVLQLLDMFKKTSNPFALVTDEYGGIQGIVTIHDIMESILGDLPTNFSSDPTLSIYKREEGTWIVDGMLPIDEFKSRFGIDGLPDEEKGIYRTLGGFCMYQLDNIPTTNDAFVWNHFRFKVVKMDGKRVDRVLLHDIRGD